MIPAQVPWNFTKGDTVDDRLLIMQPYFVHVPIEKLSVSHPLLITCAHGLTRDWPVWFEDVQQLEELNRSVDQNPHSAIFVDANTLEINTISARGRKPTGGVLIYQRPVDLTGAQATLQVLDKEGGTVLLTLSTETSGLEIVGLGAISRTLSAAQTQALTWASGVYNLRVTYPDGTVHRYFSGRVTAHA